MVPPWPAALAAVLVAACASTSPGPPRAVFPEPSAIPVVELDNAADGTKVTLKRGGELKVLLDAIPSTGFQWQEPAKVAPTLVELGARIYVGKGSDPRNVGAGGWNVFRFRAEQSGKLTLQFEYRRPWETVPPAKIVRYEVSVE